MTSNNSIEQRAAWHAALADPTRLRITDQLARSDRSSSELAGSLDLSTSLVAHHLDVLESVGLIERTDSTADRRRRYVRLRADAFDRLSTPLISPPAQVVFVCTHNSARSQLAAALWQERIGTEASSAGTEPAERVHPGAVHAAARIGVDITESVPQRFEVPPPTAQVITVCDHAHEALPPDPAWWHWSIADPVESGRQDAFDDVVVEIERRCRNVASSTAAAAAGARS